MAPEPAAHALGIRWLASAADADRPARHVEWNRPMTPMLVPTGAAFDAIELPCELGLETLSQLQCRGAKVGAVSLDARTSLVLFFVRVGSRQRIAQGLAEAGLTTAAAELAADGGEPTGCQPPRSEGKRPKADGALGLRYHGRGAFVLVPPPTPCRLGPSQWLVLPGAFGARTDVTALITAISAAWHVSRLVEESAYRPDEAPAPDEASAPTRWPAPRWALA